MDKDVCIWAQLYMLKALLERGGGGGGGGTMRYIV